MCGRGIKKSRSWIFFGVEKSSKIDFPKIVIEHVRHVFMLPPASETRFRTTSRCFFGRACLMITCLRAAPSRRPGGGLMPHAASHTLQAGELTKITNARNLLAPAVRLLRRAALSVAELLRSRRGVSKIV